ncbi:pirin family protein [Labedella endophytica]|uniref:Pirin family protein n=1 Tax=Labedella endophytica TaxID=1523160 RepID=A0A3S0Y2V0_9MICO|nr:pirin family protein [Labedella endophytica]RUR03461.1 pirin family protein [Labedella endophytica]
MTRLDAETDEPSLHRDGAPGPVVELLDAREVPLGGVRGITVHRTLPQRALPMVGAWCFLDRFDHESAVMRVLPHPHIGLQTVTWPIDGDIRHRDSVGSDVVVAPGQLNMMTAGLGISHSELSLPEEPAEMHGLQLWTALPAASAHVAPFFEQHTELPVHRQPGLAATVMLGTLGGATSPAMVFSPLLGADIVVEPGTDVSLPLDTSFEHAVLVLSGTVTVAGTRVSSGPLLYLGSGRSVLAIESTDGARFVLLGGEPFEDDLVMWWNFVGRDHDEIVAARTDWEARNPRFGVVEGHGDDRIPAPPLPTVRLTPRRRRPIQPG